MFEAWQKVGCVADWLTCHSEPAHLLPCPAVLPHEEGVGGAAALQEAALVSQTAGEQEEQEEQEEQKEISLSTHHSLRTDCPTLAGSPPQPSSVS